MDGQWDALGCTALYPPLLEAPVIVTELKWRLVNHHFVYGRRQIEDVQGPVPCQGEMEVYGTFERNMNKKHEFEASNFSSF